MEPVTKTALVTGASSGIGRATALAFAIAGYRVLATGRDQARLDLLTAAHPDGIETVVGDIDGPKACADLVETCVSRFGRLDVLVNCAGIIKRADVEHTTDADWRSIMGVNLDAPFYLSRAALPHLRETKGRIINVASDWGLRGGEHAAAYCASKGGLVLLTRAMARDHAREGITINAVCPGDVVTPMLEKEAADEGLALSEALKTWDSESPSGRMTQPDEVAALILYLASDAAAQINGTAMLIDGGLCA
ncbi:SDR family oxidoreductase [Kordiimonas sp. A6E486]|nr:SDR family oxidoreductase [Kordiimonas marina]MCJ9429859.1 SDR family oxidoreductase [Kordiimonas marina]